MINKHFSRYQYFLLRTPESRGGVVLRSYVFRRSELFVVRASELSSKLILLLWVKLANQRPKQKQIKNGWYVKFLSLSLSECVCRAIINVVYAGTKSEREEKVSLELSEEILQSMEVGMTFRDYVILFHSIASSDILPLQIYSNNFVERCALSEFYSFRCVMSWILWFWCA